ncbi:hypothetical protein [Candidatus Amarolinea dominans]|uniref:hypothetical protein n=1 Tax=Candidatus Amarolinea dominans TaxID=3140696 RepID=UPI0031CC8728
MPTPLYRLNAVVSNNAIYVIGGRPSTTTISRKIYRSVRSNGGALGNWVEMGSDILPEARADAVSLRRRASCLSSAVRMAARPGRAYMASRFGPMVR